MEDLSLCGALAGWTDPDLEVLVELGWSVTKLATLRGCGAKILETVLISARKKKESFCQEAAALQDLIAQCDKRSANIHRADAGKGSQDLLEAHMEHQREKRRKVLQGLGEIEVTERIKLVGTGLQMANSPGEETSFSRLGHGASRDDREVREG